MSAVFTGMATALVTPFTQDGTEIDEESLKSLALRQVEAGADALVVLGTTGEPSTMNMEEKERVLGRVAEAVKGRIPVIAGVGSNDTRKAAENARMARETGADALLAVTPYYNKCTQDGLIAYFEAIARAGELPVILYNVPSRTGMNLLPETAQKLSAHPLMAGLKEAGSDMVQLGRAAQLMGGECPVYSGCDELCLPALSLGARGLISVAANLAPGMVLQMVRSFMSGDTEKALGLNARLSRLNQLLFCQVSPIPCKSALQMMGLANGQVRPPLTRLSRKYARPLRQELEHLGLIN